MKPFTTYMDGRVGLKKKMDLSLWGPRKKSVEAPDLANSTLSMMTNPGPEKQRDPYQEHRGGFQSTQSAALTSLLSGCGSGGRCWVSWTLK